MLAGEELFYSWRLKGGQIVEGPSVQLALIAVRLWGNCGVQVDTRVEGDYFVFTARFTDIETGFTLDRTFRQRIKQDTGMKDSERAQDIVFQIGQSKAIRNVVINAMPSWLINRMMDQAKENVIGRIRTKGVAKAKEDTIAFFERYSITVERIEKKIGIPKSKWTEEALARLHGDIKALTSGEEFPDELFPPIEVAKKEPPAKQKPDQNSNSAKTEELKTDKFTIENCSHKDDPSKCNSSQKKNGKNLCKAADMAECPHMNDKSESKLV